MTAHAQYMPGPASGAQVKKDGENWTLVLTREIRHSPNKVWDALTDPAQLKEWAPFDADKSMATAGATVQLATVNAPAPHVIATTIKRAEPPRVLEYNWGGGDVRWELAPLGAGTRLTLWASIPRNWVSMGAAGWHICLDVLDRFLGGDPVGRMVGTPVMKFEGWQRLTAEYGKQFGVEPPSWPGKAS